MSKLAEYFKKQYYNNYDLLKENTKNVQNFCEINSICKEDKNTKTHRVKSLGAPIAYSKEAYDDFVSLSNNFYKIFNQIIYAYINDCEVRKAFGYKKEIEKLIVANRGYSNLLPMARFDIFYNPKNRDFKFIEINTDGTACQFENDILNKSLSINKVFLDSLSTSGYTYQQFDYYSLWIKSFIEIYNEFFQNKVKEGFSHFNPKPNIAIVDFLDKAYLSDFVAFKNNFEKKGYNTQICEITKLKYDGTSLYSEDGMKIDAIYKRAVTGDVLASLDMCQPLINAYIDGNICLVGGFNTQLIHNKKIFALLSDDSFLTMLNDKKYISNNDISLIKKHIPTTKVLSNLSEKEISFFIKNKDNWIIKPLDSYDGGGGIFLGQNENDNSWEKIMNNCLQSGEFLIQEYNQPISFTNYEIINSELIKQEYNYMPGLYIYAGTMSGIYTRVSPGKIIGNAFDGYEVCSLIERKSL